MATWIRTSVRPEEVFPANGKKFTLDELQRYVGGYIEVLPLKGGLMWLNEEGKLKGLPHNPMADQIAHTRSRIAAWDHIVGDVLVEDKPKRTKR